MQLLEEAMHKLCNENLKITENSRFKGKTARKSDFTHF